MELLGRYEILGELGRGAMGTVYRARDPKIDRIVAVKTIRALGLSADDEAGYRERFFREAQAAGKLSHPGIVTIYDVGEEETTKTPYIVMECVSGQTVESLLTGKAAERLPLETTLDLVKQIAEGLDYAHAQGIVHRDIKPANILVTAENRAKITDFGIAKLAVTQFTMTGVLLGTPSYMSPEQLNGKTVDGRSDLFSLGIILYWMLTRKKPFTGENLTEVSFKIAYKDPVPATQLNPSLGLDFNYVLDRALAKDPARRYQRGKEIADDLADLCEGRPPRSQSSAVLEPDIDRTIVQEGTIIQAQTIVQNRPLISKRTAVAASFPRRLQQRVRDSLPVARTWIAQTGAHLLPKWHQLLEFVRRLLIISKRTAVQCAKVLLRIAAVAAPFLRKLPQRVRDSLSVASTWIAQTGAFLLPKWHQILDFVRRLPRKTRIATAIGILLLAFLAFQPWKPAQLATLHINSQHKFPVAELSVWIDNDLTYNGKLTGAVKRRWGIFSSVQGSFSEIVQVPVGRRTVRVRVDSPDEGYNQTTQIEGEFIQGAEKTLDIIFAGGDKDLSLVLR
ncbi:MAG: serine/threonine protein kinase [Acidobacteria bacterium]|nr:serine/threonine protein kinase [Acidobacteriota bacterium]